MRSHPAVRARLIGTLLTTPPSTSTSPSIVTGGKIDGMAEDAMMASTAGPWAIQRSRPSVSEVVTTSTGITASSRYLELHPGLDDPAQPGVGVHRGALLEPGPRAVERAAREDVGAADAAPDVGHVLDALGGGVAGVGRAVDRPDGRAEDPVGADAPSHELFEHADLHGAAAAAARQHERRALRGHDVPPAGGVPPPVPARPQALAPGEHGRADVIVAVAGAGVAVGMAVGVTIGAAVGQAERAHGSDRGGRCRNRARGCGGASGSASSRARHAASWRSRHARRPTMSWRTAHTITITTSTTRATTKSPNTTTKAAFVAGTGGTKAGVMHLPG